jgi:DNA-binding transcriptional MerR regulator
MYIGQAARLAGTTPKTIRHYEVVGLLHKPERRGKYRVYSAQSVEIVRFIKCAQKLGFKLHEIQAIMRHYDQQAFPWDLAHEAIDRKKNELSAEIRCIQQQLDALADFEQDLLLAKEECSLIPPPQSLKAQKKVGAEHRARPHD